MSRARAIWPTNGPVRPPLTTGRKVVIAPLLPPNYAAILSASLINNNVFASGDTAEGAAPRGARPGLGGMRRRGGHCHGAQRGWW